MAISKQDVQYVANLARIELTDKELDRFSKQLEKILVYIDQLKQVNIKGVLPTSHVLNIKNIYREDSVRQSIDIEEFQKSVPGKEDTFFKVPKVIE